MAVSIAQLSFEHHREALGIGESEPRISWRFAGNASNWEQSSYDLEVSRLGKTTQYSTKSSDSIFVPWPDKPLGSVDAARVRVRAHAAGQPSTPWSDWVAAETGLLKPEDWSGAVPIAADRDYDINAPKQPIYFRKEFPAAADVKSARLYITALGLYEAYINGHRVGDAVLAPGWQSYNNRHVYDTYDVTNSIRKGQNAIGVTVGEGWFMGRIAFAGRNFWGNNLGLQVLLTVTTKDGKTTSIPTDDSWSANTGPILSSEIYDGETYDSRLEADIAGWNEPSFNSTSSSKWVGVKSLPPVKGQLMSPDGPPVRKVEERQLEKVFKSPSGKTLIDFGQNLVGWLHLNVEGPAGTNITLHHAEVLEKGELALGPLRTAKATDTVILHGNGPQTWEPSFTFHGFRYAQIDGWPEETPLDAKAVKAIVVHSDLEQTGWFQCSNALLNKFHSNVMWSTKGNFLSISTDCPQRDERLGWTGDAHAFGPTANFLYNTGGFWRGWHRDMWSEMKRGNSMKVPFFVPTVPPDSDDPGAAVWSDVAVGGPWDLFRFYGDVGMLAEQFPQGQAWIDRGLPRNEAGLWKRDAFQFGDWLDPKAPPEDPGAATTAKALVADAYLIRMTELLANMSGVLGDAATEKSYRAQHSALRKQFAAAWITNGSSMANRTQTAYALALHFDLLPASSDDDDDASTSGSNNTAPATSGGGGGNRAAAAATLQQIVAENDYLVGTGFAGTPALGPALQGAGATDDFYSMLLQTKVPSWLYQVVMNGTTTWERWDSMLPDGTINTGTMTSFNHYAFGAVADWIHATVGGLAPAEPGWKVVAVEPVPGGGITSADARLVSPYGEIKSSWWVDAAGFHLKLSLPPNAKASVKLPRGADRTVVGSGLHEFHEDH
ncbi:hypothetical protein LMH87_003461 [Akanthomyces muscarius]|nr:hypothetical protein LMH87_003461 [Akanthomyces muscarius]KAJ4144580.1 hypothetical protein LMH87_003461 [Akanthomyces muscarius]